MATASTTVFVPATIGNVGPGFDVLGLAIDGLGDEITVELHEPGPQHTTSRIGEVIGRDAALIPRDASQNCAVIAALSLLRRIGLPHHVTIHLDRALPVSGGLGASAAASVGGALAAAIASGQTVSNDTILAAALDGEAHVAGRHLDNIAPCLLGGLVIIRSVDPLDVVPVNVTGEWWAAVVTPAFQLSTKLARSVLAQAVSQRDMVAQMAHTAALVTAFAQGDHALAKRALVDQFAEPKRGPLIPQFAAVKNAALAQGALGCTISGAGPTLFALCTQEAEAYRCAIAMRAAWEPLGATAHIGRVPGRGAGIA